MNWKRLLVGAGIVVSCLVSIGLVYKTFNDRGFRRAYVDSIVDPVIYPVGNFVTGLVAGIPFEDSRIDAGRSVPKEVETSALDTLTDIQRRDEREFGSLVRIIEEEVPEDQPLTTLGYREEGEDVIPVIPFSGTRYKDVSCVGLIEDNLKGDSFFEYSPSSECDSSSATAFFRDVTKRDSRFDEKDVEGLVSGCGDVLCQWTLDRRSGKYFDFGENFITFRYKEVGLDFLKPGYCQGVIEGFLRAKEDGIYPGKGCRADAKDFFVDLGGWRPQGVDIDFLTTMCTPLLCSDFVYKVDNGRGSFQLR